MLEFKHKSIYKVKDFIDLNFNKQISISDLEELSFSSYRNLQRIFFSLFNETIGAYKARQKTENGYKLLLYSKKSITQIAEESGFSDLQAFSKAFKKDFGFAPSEALKKKEILFKKNDFIAEINRNIEPEIIEIQKKTIYFKNYRTDYLNPEIECFWVDLLKNCKPNAESSYFGIIKDDLIITTNVKCTYETAISFENTVCNLPKKEILGGHYAKFKHYGPYETINQTYCQIYGSWILENQLEFSFSPIIEHYIKHDSNTKDKKDFVTDILIPIL